ncbi:hypothetical protein JCM10213_008284 [Rhodosporidiobolus nylandii]
MLDTLPPELIEQVLADPSLDRQDWRVCCLVSRAVLAVARAQLYRRMEVEVFTTEEPSIVLAVTQIPPTILRQAHLGPIVRESDLSFCTDPEDQHAFTMTPLALFSACPSVTVVHTTAFESEPLAILEYAPGSLQTVEGVWLDGDTSARLARLPSLSSLSCTYNDADDDHHSENLSLLSPFPSLQALRISGRGMPSAVFDRLTSKSIDSLRTLDVSLPWLTTYDLRPFAHLDTLFLSVSVYCDGDVGIDALRAVFVGTVNLRTLVLTPQGGSRLDLLKSTALLDALPPSLVRLDLTWVEDWDVLRTFVERAPPGLGVIGVSGLDTSLGLKRTGHWRHRVQKIFLHKAPPTQEDLLRCASYFDAMEAFEFERSWLIETKLLKVLKRVAALTDDELQGDSFGFRQRSRALRNRWLPVVEGSGALLPRQRLSQLCAAKGIRLVRSTPSFWDYC